MAGMNRILVICGFAVVLMAGLLEYLLNSHRFVPVAGTAGAIPQVLDTKTGQYCSPWQEDDIVGHSDYFMEPNCSDLAKHWW
jgi:hypothetical protein